MKKTMKNQHTTYVGLGKLVAAWLKKEAPNAYAWVPQAFPHATGAYVVGGAVRDYFLEKKPMDLDIVVEGVTSEELLAIAGGIPTLFRNGITVHTKDSDIDVWPLPETYGVKLYHLPPTIEGVLDSFPLSTDKMGLDIRTNKLYDGGCLSSLDKKTISYGPYGHLEPIQAARAIIYKHKFGFGFDESVSALLHRAAKVLQNKSEEKELAAFLSKKYPEYMQTVLDEIRNMK